FVTQELKDFIVVPRVQGNAVRLHPAIILVLIVVAGRLAGFWGLLLVVPVAAVLRDSFVYVYHRLGEQPALALPEPGEPRALTPIDREPPARASRG
ncbi:MAG TPA: AI-2E family transporter, partial [Dehalococcoidia bacterium]|nr:AI-2E family transporter [Dehalococcoidia bacterium]